MPGAVFNAGAIEATARINRTEFKRDARELQREIRSLERNVIGIPVKIDRQSVRRELEGLKSQLAGSQALKLPIGIDSRAARREIGEFRTYIRNLAPTNIKIGATTAQARRDIAAYRQQIRNLAPTNLSIGANTRQVHRDINELRRELRSLSGADATVDVDANIASAMAAMRTAERQRESLDGSSANIHIGADASRALGIIGLVIAGLSTISYAAPAATAALVSVGTMGGAALQGVGALSGGLYGVGDAVKALTDTTTTGAASSISAHNAHVDAVAALERAYGDAARTAIRSDEAVADARRNLQNAHREASRSIETAQERLVDAYTSGAQRIESADERVADTQRQARFAQEDLNRAREEAIEYIEDLSLALDRSVLSEEEAYLDLLDAQEKLANARRAGVTGRDLQRVDLEARQAAQSYKEIQERLEDLQEEQAQVAREGVEGNERVVNAQRRVDSATRASQEAQRDLQRTHAEVSDDIQDAQRDLIRAQEDGSRRVANALRSFERQQRDARWAQEDAARAIVDAQRNVAQAMQRMGTVGSSQADKVQEAMSKLTPEGRSFARFLAFEMIPSLRDIGAGVQSAMLPEMEESLRRLIGLQPMVKSGLSGTGDVMGDLAVIGSQMATSGPFRKDFAAIMESNNRMLKGAGIAGLTLTSAFTSLWRESLPMTEGLTQAGVEGAILFDEFIQGKRETGELAGWFDLMGDRLERIWNWFVDVAESAYHFGVALAPVGDSVLTIVGGLAQFVGWMSELNPELVQFLAYGALAYTLFVNIGKGVIALGSASAIARRGWRRLLAMFAPGVMGTAAASATTGLATVSGAVTRTGDNADRARGKVRGFTTAVGRVGTPLTILGGLVGTIAWDHFILGVDEATAAMEKGGIAADNTRRALETQSGVVDTMKDGWASWIPLVEDAAWIMDFFVPSVDDVNEALWRQRDAMTNVERATSFAKEAQGDYEQALREHGENHPKTVARLQEYKDAQAGVAWETERAARAERDNFEAILQRQGLVLSSIEADSQYRESLARVTEGIIENGATVDLNTEAGRRNHENLRTLIQDATEHIQRMDEEGATYGQLSEKAGIYEQQAYDQAVAMGVSKEEAWRLTEGIRGLRVKYEELPPEANTDVNARGAQVAKDQIEAVDRAVRELDGKEANVFVRFWRGLKSLLNPFDDDKGLPWGRAQGALTVPGVYPMQFGGRLAPMSGQHAEVVPPNSLRVIGDNMRVPELFAPLDGSGRSLRLILDALRMYGFNVEPMQRGGILGSLSAVADTIAQAQGSRRAIGGRSGTEADPQRAAESLQRAMRDLINAALEPLSVEINSKTVPTLDALRRKTGIELTDVFTGFEATTQRTWQQNAQNVTRSVLQQSGQFNMLSRNLNASGLDMQNTITRLMDHNNRSFANIQTFTGQQVGIIRGQHFGSLQSGMQTNSDVAANMARAFQHQFNLVRGYTANPIRWTLQFPINAGMVQAWNKINEQFLLKRPMAQVPITFAEGGRYENHIAQLAAPGMTRIWNEPETHGEYYIPRAMSKRQRSTQILQQAANDFDYDLVPHDAEYFADGGLWRQMWQIVRGAFPRSRLTSQYRPGDSGYHGSGRAIDIAGPRSMDMPYMLAQNRWLADHFANSTQLIHTQPGAINLLNGRRHVYNAGTRADHRDHNHWAMANAAMLRGAGNGGGLAALGYMDPAAMMEQEFARTRQLIAQIHTRFGLGNLPTGLTRMSNDAVSGAVKFGSDQLAMMGPGPGSGVERWRGVGLRALGIARQPANEIGRLLMQMQSESGGDPNIVNRWDSNWYAGHPSVGLMQVIGPTYQRHKHPNFDFPPYLYGTSTNPISNVLSSIRYTLSRYGSLAAGWKGHGYRDGGTLDPGEWGFNETNDTEYVFNKGQLRTTVREAFSAGKSTQATTMVSPASGDTYTFYLTAPQGSSVRELVDELNHSFKHNTRRPGRR